MVSMRDIVIKDFNMLREYLEDPINYEYYKCFLGKEVVNASVEKYEHPDGAIIEGESGRWWVYVRAYGEKDGYFYDIALWKLRKLLPLLIRQGLIEIKRSETVRKLIELKY